MKLEHLKLVKLDYLFKTKLNHFQNTWLILFINREKKGHLWGTERVKREKYSGLKEHYILQIWMPFCVDSHDYIVRKFAPREATLFRCVSSPREESLPFSKRHVTCRSIIDLRFVCTWLNVLSIQRIRNAGNTHSLLSWFIIWRPRKREIYGQSVALTTAV